MITLRRVCWVTGIIGMLLLAAGAPWISKLSFGSTEHAWAIALLGPSIFFTNLSNGQLAILQGTRRIGDLAKVKIAAAFFGTIVSVALYWWLGMQGIVPALIALALVTLAVSTHYSRKVPLKSLQISWAQSLQGAHSLLKLGSSLVVASLVATGAAFAIRAFLTNEMGLQSVGIYAAAYTLSGLFVQFVLQAMSADFYPRLTAVSDDPAAMTRLINEQTEVGLLLAFPGLLATLAFAPFVITVFYTSEFAAATELLKWFVVGCMGRVLSWPMGFCLLAKGQGKLFAGTETTFNLLHILLVVGLIAWQGLVGAAIAFAGLYCIYTLGLLLVTRYLIQFRWSPSVLKHLGWMVPVAVTCFWAETLFQPAPSAIFGGVVSFVSSILCFRQLADRIESQHRYLKLLRKITFSSHG